MKNIAKISRKFLMLGAMLIVLGLVTFSDKLIAPAGAAPCCSECEAGEQQCIDDGGTPFECFQQYRNCYRWCSFSC